jgi:hypothetical protein
MWQYGLVMNVHLTICWRLLGVMNHAWAVKLYKHEAAKWLDVGIGDGVERCRLSRRASGTSAQHVFVYTHDLRIRFACKGRSGSLNRFRTR